MICIIHNIIFFNKSRQISDNFLNHYSNFMELDKFISESLKAVIKGVADSQDFAKEKGARVNPYIGQWDTGKTFTTYYGREEGARAISNIDFDIAVTTSNEQEAGGHGGINVLSFKVGGKISDKDIQQTVSRIKFSVNVVLPNVEP